MAVEEGGGGNEKEESGKGNAGGRGAKSGSAASDGKNTVHFTTAPLPGEAIDNYAVLNLDKPDTAQCTWRTTILLYRLWCFSKTKQRYYFGHEQRQSCMMPEAGHFLVYVHYHGKWMCLVIDGPTGYLTGYITRSLLKDKRIQENKTKLPKKFRKELESELPLYIEGAEMLPWEGSYLLAARCLLGYMGLVNSFEIMYNHIEGLQTFAELTVQEAGENFILHIPEAGRSDRLFHQIDANFMGFSTLGQKLLIDARNWSVRTKKAFGIMVDLSPDKWALKKRGKSTVRKPESMEPKQFGSEVEERLQIIEDLRLFYRGIKVSRKLLLKELHVHLGPQGPVNSKT